MRADLNERAADFDAGNDLAGNGASRDPGRRFARGRTPAAAIVADAVFGVIGVVGVARAIFGGDVAVVFGALIHVVDLQRDGRAGRDLFALVVIEDTREDLHFVGFAPLRGEARLTGLALVEEGLDLSGLDGDTRRAAVNDTADAGTVAFAPSRDAEEMTKSIVRHACSDAFCAAVPGEEARLVTGASATLCCCQASLVVLGAPRGRCKPNSQAKFVTRRRDADYLAGVLRPPPRKPRLQTGFPAAKDEYH